MTEIQRAEALRQVAHDLKNPLTAVRVLAEMLLDDAGPTMSGDLIDIVEAVDVAAVTADGLSDLARLECGDEPTYAPDIVDLGEIAGEIVSRAAFARVCLRGSQFQGSARADDHAIERTLNGVMLNGRRMLKPHDMLTVSVIGSCIEVFHPGVCIDAESKEALMNIYGGPTLKARRVRASALGLGYAREVLEAIGGCMEFEDHEGGMLVRLSFTPV